MVLVAKERATQLNSGLEATVDRDNDKNTVIALEEIANENVKVSDLTDSAVYKLRKHVEQVDDTSEEDEEVVMISKIYIKVKFLKVVFQYYHLKELKNTRENTSI